MTEDEAKRQQCIGPRNCGQVIRTGSLDPDNFPRLCVGSACMAWRSTSSLFARDLESGRERHVPAGGYYNVHKEEAFYRRDGGYCGLAGKT